MSLKRTACLTACLSLPVSALGYDLKSNGEDYGKMDLMAKAMGVISAKDNGYDPNDGKSYLLKAKYTTPTVNGFKAAAGLYMNGDLFGWTDFETERVARGMFVNNDGAHKGQLGEIYARYDAERFNAYGGRMMLKTPLTSIAYSTMPNFYTAFGVGGKPMDKFDLGLMHISEMSFGARAMTDFGLIGEGTRSAGAATRPDLIGQATFHDIGTITFGNGAPSTDGITAVSASYSGLPHSKLQLWNYYVHDIANNVYFDVASKIPMGGVKALLGAQFLHQNDVGESLGGDLDYTLFGLKAGVAGKGWSLWGAYNNSSGDSAFLNGWGGDPAYTSTIFSRNAYRENVDAWGIGGKYVITKGLAFIAKYMDYGKSDTLGRLGGIGTNLPALENANELDLILVWKPKQVKGLMIKTFYANRTSEYDGTKGLDLTQSHWRLIAAYKF